MGLFEDTENLSSLPEAKKKKLLKILDYEQSSGLNTLGWLMHSSFLFYYNIPIL